MFSRSLDKLPGRLYGAGRKSEAFWNRHALLCCKDVVKEPFVVINADDYYGPKAFQMMYDFLTTHEDGEKYSYAMIGYYIENTITENGSVARESVRWTKIIV